MPHSEKIVNNRTPQPARAPSVLIVDSCQATRHRIIEALGIDSFQFIEADTGLTAWRRYIDQRPIAILASADIRGLEPCELLARVRNHSTSAFAVYSRTNHAPIAVSLMRAGVDDFFVIPDDLESLATRLAALIATGRSSRDSVDSLIVGQSRLIARVRDKVISVSGLRIPVLLSGEPGSGLDHIARVIASREESGLNSLVTVRPSCSRAPQKSDAGRVIYLDHVDELSIGEQGEWFDQIQRSERADKSAPRRILASTTENLLTLAASKRCDTNLARRLSQFSIEIPPLRDRVDDIVPLAKHLASRIASEMGRPRVLLTTASLRVLQSHQWRGNARELRQVVERLVAFSVDGEITRRNAKLALSEVTSSIGSLRTTREQKQRDELIAMLDATGGNLAETARRMNMSRGAIIYRAQKFGLLSKRVRTEPVPRRPRASAP
jgi:DNA-binding NtrC family response regulator